MASDWNPTEMYQLMYDMNAASRNETTTLKKEIRHLRSMNEELKKEMNEKDGELEFIHNTQHFYVVNSNGKPSGRKTQRKSAYERWLEEFTERLESNLTPDLTLLGKAIYHESRSEENEVHKLGLDIPSIQVKLRYKELRKGLSRKEALKYLWDKGYRSLNGKKVFIKHPYMK